MPKLPSLPMKNKEAKVQQIWKSMRKSKQKKQKAVNTSQNLPQEENDFLKQLSRIEELANMAEEDQQSRARIAQEGKCKRRQRRRKCRFTTKKALKRARERLRKFPTKANLQALQEGLDGAGAPKKSRPLPTNVNPTEEVIESPFHTAYEHLSVS